MKIAILLLSGLSLVFMAGCAAFEVTPADVQEKLTHPMAGRLYDPDSMRNHLESDALNELARQ